MDDNYGKTISMVIRTSADMVSKVRASAVRSNRQSSAAEITIAWQPRVWSEPLKADRCYGYSFTTGYIEIVRTLGGRTAGG